MFHGNAGCTEAETRRGGFQTRPYETPINRHRLRHSHPSLPRKRESMGAIYMREPCVYILANKPNGTLYIGVTSNLIQRVWQHKSDSVEGFTKRYRVHRLVWHESHGSMKSAIIREKALKKRNRAWKIELIERGNPTWSDLYEEIC